MNAHLAHHPPSTGPASGRLRNAFLPGAVVGLVAMLAFIGFLQRDGEATGTFQAAPPVDCLASDDKVIDEQARLCYDIPAGWTTAPESDLQEYSDGSDGTTYTSGLVADQSKGIVVYASPDGHLMYANEGMSLEQVTEDLASRTLRAIASDGLQIDTRTTTIHGFEAATSTASVPIPDESTESDEPVAGWARATMVDLGEGVSFVYSAMVVTEAELLQGDGRIAEMNAVHDSISVHQEEAPEEGLDALGGAARR